MKSSLYILVLSAVVVFSSCSTAYKSGQTPDDVYYSPAREQDEYVQVENKDDRYYRSDDDYYEDRYLRMRVQNRYRWSALDDYYFNTPYAYHYNSFYSNWYSPWNNYWSWNNFYNPYYGGGVVVIKNPTRFVPPSRPIAFSPLSYAGSGNPQSNLKNSNQRYSNSFNNNNQQRYNNSNNSNSFGNSIRKVFNGNNNNNTGNNYNNNNNGTPTRSYNPPANNNSSSGSRTSSGSSSSGSSSSGTTRPPR